MNIGTFQPASTGISGSRVSLNPPSTSAGMRFSLSPTVAMSQDEDDYVPGVIIVEASRRPQPCEILFVSATTTQTQGNNEISHVTMAEPGKWEGDLDQVMYGAVSFVENTDDGDRWVVTYQKEGVQSVNNLWAGLYTGSLPPGIVVGLSLGANGLIPWVKNEPSDGGNPVTGEQVPELKAKFHLHRRAKSKDEIIQLVPDNHFF